LLRLFCSPYTVKLAFKEEGEQKRAHKVCSFIQHVVAGLSERSKAD
jgi:hypothetical protein